VSEMGERVEGLGSERDERIIVFDILEEVRKQILRIGFIQKCISNDYFEMVRQLN
jgi:hypothetical protein